MCHNFLWEFSVCSTISACCFESALNPIQFAEFVDNCALTGSSLCHSCLCFLLLKEIGKENIPSLAFFIPNVRKKKKKKKLTKATYLARRILPLFNSSKTQMPRWSVEETGSIKSIGLYGALCYHASSSNHLWRVAKFS